MTELTILDHVPLWAFVLGTLATTLVTADSGYRLGQRRQLRAAIEKQESKGDGSGTVVGAMLGLLAFLLAFTFGLAASRYDTRREVFQEELNAIRTTYLRSSFLPDPRGKQVRALLRDYVDARLEGDQSGASLAEAIRKSDKIQVELWQHASAIGHDLDKPGAPNSDMLALFVDSLNQSIEADGKRRGALFRGRVPAAMWAGLFSISLIAVFSMGYDIGQSNEARPLAGVGLILCFAVTMWLIADLDRPMEGFVRVNHQGMINLRESFNADSR